MIKCVIDVKLFDSCEVNKEFKVCCNFKIYYGKNV